MDNEKKNLTDFILKIARYAILWSGRPNKVDDHCLDMVHEFLETHTVIEWHPWGENMPEQNSDLDLLWWYPYENDMGEVHRNISQLNTSDSYYRHLYGHRDKEGNYLPGQYWAYAPQYPRKGVAP